MNNIVTMVNIGMKITVNNEVRHCLVNRLLAALPDYRVDDNMQAEP
jgi:hypothetical protein